MGKVFLKVSKSKDSQSRLFYTNRSVHSSTAPGGLFSGLRPRSWLKSGSTPGSKEPAGFFGSYFQQLEKIIPFHVQLAIPHPPKCKAHFPFLIYPFGWRDCFEMWNKHSFRLPHGHSLKAGTFVNVNSAWRWFSPRVCVCVKLCACLCLVGEETIYICKYCTHIQKIGEPTDCLYTLSSIPKRMFEWKTKFT